MASLGDLAHAQAVVKGICRSGETALGHFEHEVGACQGEYGEYVFFY
jgi:hypothetical protein